MSSKLIIPKGCEEGGGEEYLEAQVIFRISLVNTTRQCKDTRKKQRANNGTLLPSTSKISELHLSINPSAEKGGGFGNMRELEWG